MAGDDSTIARIFDKLEIIGQDVAAIKARDEEKSKKCEEHNKEIEKHDGRIHSLEIWRAREQGISSFLQRWGPVLLTSGIAAYVAHMRG